MNGIGTVTSVHQAAHLPRSTPRAADQTAANSAHAAKSRAASYLSAARGQADPDAIRTAQGMLSAASAATITADAWVKSDSGLNIMA
jgi:hypothetical protein